MLISLPFEKQENIICQMEKKCSFQASKSSDNGEKKYYKKQAAPFSRFCFQCIMHD